MGGKDQVTIFSGNASFHHVSRIFSRQFSDAKILRQCLFNFNLRQNSLRQILSFVLKDASPAIRLYIPGEPEKSSHF